MQSARVDGREPGLATPEDDSDPECAHCHDSYRIRVSITDREDPRWPGYVELCQCVANRRPDTERMVKASAVPPMFDTVTIASWKPETAQEAHNLRIVLSYCASWPPTPQNLVLYGNKGTGKTHLACAVIREVREKHGVFGRFEEVIPLMERLRHTFDDDSGETLSSIIASINAAPLLVLDDVAAENKTGWTNERLLALVNARYTTGKPMVITTNASGEDINERIFDRLFDRQRSAVLFFEGRSRRTGLTLGAAR